MIEGPFKSREEMFLAMPKDLVGAEIGVFKGGFSKWMCRHMEPRILYMVDLWSPVDLDYPHLTNTIEVQYKNLSIVLRSMRSEIASGVARPLMGESSRVANAIHDESLDFVYIDGDHTYDGCLRDMRSWSQKVKTGGIVAGHDIQRQEYGVTEAVRAYMEEAGLPQSDLHVTEEQFPSFWLEKR